MTASTYRLSAPQISLLDHLYDNPRTSSHDVHWKTGTALVDLGLARIVEWFADGSGLYSLTIEGRHEWRRRNPRIEPAPATEGPSCAAPDCDQPGYHTANGLRLCSDDMPEPLDAIEADEDQELHDDADEPIPYTLVDRSPLPYAPLTWNELYNRRDDVDHRIGIAITMNWHRKPEFHADLDRDAAERKSWSDAIDARHLAVMQAV